MPVLLGAVGALSGSGTGGGCCSKQSPDPYWAGSKLGPDPSLDGMHALPRGLAVGTAKLIKERMAGYCCGGGFGKS